MRVAVLSHATFAEDEAVDGEVRLQLLKWPTDTSLSLKACEALLHTFPAQ